MTGLALLAIVLSAVVLLRRTPPPLPAHWPLALLALLLQLLAHWLGPDDWLLRVSFLLLLGVAWSNRAIPGGLLLLLGVTLNALPVLVYGRMPLSPAMVEWGTQGAIGGRVLASAKSVVVEHGPLLMLGDIIPVHILGWRAAWSVGDLLLCLAIARYCLSAPVGCMQRQKPDDATKASG